MRDLVTTAMEVVGLGCVTTGAALAWPPLGFAVGGLCLLGIGYLLGREVRS